MEALLTLATNLAEEQQWERASHVIDLLDGNREKAKALVEVGIALAKAQQREQAEAKWLKVLSFVPITQDFAERSEIFLDLAMLFIKAERWEQAKAFWAEAQRVALMVEDDQQKCYTLCRIGAALNSAKQEKYAQDIWNDAKVAAYALDKEEDQDQALWILSITLAYAQQFESAHTIAQSIARNGKKADALYTLGETLICAQMEGKSEAIWEEWLNAVSALEKDDILYKLGEVLIRAQRWEQAKTVIDLMEKTWKREYLRCKLGKALARENLWEEAINIISNISNESRKVDALCVLGVMLYLSQQEEVAETIWAKCQAMADNMNTEWMKREKQDALHRIGLALAEAHLLERAEAIAHAMEEDGARADILCKVQKGLETAAGQPGQLLFLIQRSWCQAKTKDYLFKLLPMVYIFIISDMELAFAFCDAFVWVDAILKVVR